MSITLPKIIIIYLLLSFYFILSPSPLLAATCPILGSNLAGNWDEKNMQYLREHAGCSGPIPVEIVITVADLTKTEVNSGKLMINHIKDLAAKYNLDVTWRGWGNPQDYDPILHPDLMPGLRQLSGETFHPGNEQNFCTAEDCPGGQPSPEAVALVHQHLLEANLGIKVTIPPLNTLNPDVTKINPDGSKVMTMMNWKEFLTRYAAACPGCIRNASFAAANIYAPPQSPADVSAWATSVNEYYQFLKEKGFGGKLIITEAGVNPGQYQGNFAKRLQDTLAFAQNLEQKLSSDDNLAAIIDKVTFLIMDDTSGKQYFIHRTCDASGNCSWEIVEYLVFNQNIPGLISILEPELTCSGSGADEGPFRPAPCQDCGRTIEETTFSCSQSFNVEQATWANVGYTSADTGEVAACKAGSVDGAYVFSRDWGGQVKIDTSDTKVPFANYRDKQDQQEAKYLAAYFTGSYNRYGPQCDIEDPDCVRKVFREAGVMTKLLPQQKQDQLRCDMIKKVSQNQEFNYEVTDGDSKLKVSDFNNHQVPCFCLTASVDDCRLQLASPDWAGTPYEILWPFIPMVTYKDAPGVLSLYSQGPPGYLNPPTFALSFPHLGTLYEASKIVHEALTPKYEESTLAPTSQKQAVNLASSKDKQLKVDLETSQSLCGYLEGQKVLAAKTTFLAQAKTQDQTKSGVIMMEGKADYLGNAFGFSVKATKTTSYGFHIETYKFNIDGKEYAYRPGTYTPVDRSLTITNQDLGLANIPISEGQTVTIKVTLVSKDADPDGQQVFTIDGSFILQNGQFISNWGGGGARPAPSPEIRCGNPDNINPGSCQDSQALEDTENPNDVICSNPYPIVANLEVPGYSAVMSAETFEELQKKAHGCKEACDKDQNSSNCQPPCNWQMFGYLSRDIGLDLNLPYLERIGQLTLSNFYRYDTNNFGQFLPNKFAKYEPGIFDMFRPASMLHYPIYQAKSGLGYDYTSGHSNSGVTGSKSESSLIASTQTNSPTEGDLYYPWLGGVQLAKKCVSEGILLPKDKANTQDCPGFGQDTRAASEAEAPMPPSLTQEFIEEEKRIEDKKEENIILPPLPPDAIQEELPKTIPELKEYLLSQGYKDYQVDRIVANLQAYRQAENQTRIPWEVLASIHAIETNFRTDNPQNGDGPMQVVDSEHPAGQMNTFEEFVNVLVEATGIIKTKIERARTLTFIDAKKTYDKFTNEDWAQIAYFYNGRPKSQTGPDGKTYYGQEKSSWQNSGYVANGWNNNTNMYVVDGKGGWVKMQSPGFMYHLEKMQGLGL